MRGKRRLAAAILLAAMCAPGTWLRSDTGPFAQGAIAVAQVGAPRVTGEPGWRVEGVWALSGEGLLFGGYSALVTLPGRRLMAFSDRGARILFAEPGTASDPPRVARQPLSPGRAAAIPDIEAATRDPTSGAYWLALENRHSIRRFTSTHRQDGGRMIDGRALGWRANTGIEGIARFEDGRFAVLPENGSELLVYPRDPIAGDAPRRVPARMPLRGFAATDMAALPDGRLLVLLRDLDPAGGMPPFASAIAIAPAPVAGSDAVWAPAIALDLSGVVPRENYEGLAVREEAPGKIAVWLIADDNQSIMQRTLVAKLLFDPGAD